MQLTRVCPTPIPIRSASIDFTLQKGITFKPVFKFKDSDGIPLSLTVIVINFYIAVDGVLLFSINSNTATPNGSTIIITDAIGGIADILITDEETLALDLEEGNWWVTLTLSNGDTFLRGKGSIFLKEPFE